MKILWIPHAAWHIPQRAHHFAQGLAERHEVHVTNSIADFYTPRDYISSRYLKNFFYDERWDGRVVVHRIPRFSPAIFLPPLRKLNSSIFSYYVQKIIQNYQIDVVIGTFVVPPPKAPLLVFDLFDDNISYWKSVGPVKSYADEIGIIEQQYLEKSDVILAASSVLYDFAASRIGKGKLYYLPNGVNVNMNGHSDQQDRNYWTKYGITQPIAGVLGNNDKLAEVEKMIDAASLLKDENVVFMIAGRGKSVQPGQEIARKRGLNNVIFSGYVPITEAPQAVNSFKVGVAPYIKSPGADACCPMKVLAYSALGLPTVCTNLEEVKRLAFPNVVLAEDNPVSLADGIKKALSQPRIIPKNIGRFEIRFLINELEMILTGK